MKTLVLLTVLLSAASLQSPRPVLLGFPQLSDLLNSPEDLYAQVRLCPHSAEREVDGKGHGWPRYCRVDRHGEETEVVFRREYTEAGWTYLIDQFKGRREMQFRVVEHIGSCAEKQEEKDGQGLFWPLWCYSDGSKVQFQQISPEEQGWSYVQDKDGGVRLCQYRRILHDKVAEAPQFLETKWSFLWNIFGLQEDDEDEIGAEREEIVPISEPIEAPIEKETHVVVLKPQPQAITQEEAPSDCYLLETDPSERYFWVQYDSKGRQIAFEKDSRGNYLLNNTTYTRIPLAPHSDFQDNTLTRNIALSCPALDASGREISFKSDEAIPGVYWADTGLRYEPSLTQEQQAYGMYQLDPSTGQRIPVILS